MTISIQTVGKSDNLNLCHQMQVAIFHHELQLFGMQIPDDYDQSSVYMQILDANVFVGTYRIVLPNASVGLPIEESGFDLKRFHQKKVCEMSRLVLLKEKRGTIPFSKIIYSACEVAKQHNASILLAAILPRNFPLFKRYGFSQVGLPLYDSSVKSIDTEESVIIPMQIHI
ncbi:MAG: GNAT family N-acetyltransferase [Symploca sp. SIO2G7]|nr:GNAT family N-acetyltransferase [Symploca sp. SIO2G7]